MLNKNVVGQAALTLGREMRENACFFTSISSRMVHRKERACVLTDEKDVEFWKAFKNLEMLVDGDGEFLKLCGWDEDVVFESVSLDSFNIEEILKIARKV